MQLLTGQAANEWYNSKYKQPKAPQPQQQGGGLVGFLQGVGKSIGSDFERVGKGTANVINEFTGGAQRERDLNTQRNQQDIQLIKSYGQKIRSAKNPQEKQRYRNALSNLMNTSQQQDTDFQKRQQQIVEENDPLKGAAATLGIGLDVLGGGAGGSILKGGLLKAIGRSAGQGALFGGAQGALQPVKEKGGQASLEDIIGNATSGAGIGAITGGVTGAGAGVASKLLNRLTGNKGVQAVERAVEGQPSRVQKLGQRLTEGGSGLKAEPTVGGINKLEKQAQFMKKYTGTPRQQRIAMEKDMGDLSNQVDEILSKNKVPIKGTEVRTQVQQAIDDPLKYADVDLSSKGVQRALDSHLNKFAGTKTAKELNDYIKQLNPIAKKAQEKIARGVNITDKEAAALTAKRAGDEVLSAIPEIKPLKQNMAQIFETTPQVAKAAEKGIGLPMASGIGTKAPVQAAKYAQSKVGALLQGKLPRGKVDQKALAAAFTPDVTGKLTQPEMTGNAALRGAFGGLVNPAVSRDAAIQQPEEVPQPTAEETANPLGVDMTAQQQPTSQSIFNKDNIQALILQDLVQNGGKNVDTLLSLYKMFGEEPTQKPLSAESAKTISNAQTGLNALDQIQQALQQDPGLQQRGGISGTFNPFGLVSGALGTGEYENARAQARDVIARIRTGAALTADEAKAFDKFLPQPGDSAGTVQQKLDTLRNQFQYIVNNTGGASPSASDITQLTGAQL